MRFSRRLCSIVRNRAPMHWKLKHVMVHHQHVQIVINSQIQVSTFFSFHSYSEHYIHPQSNNPIPFLCLSPSQLLYNTEIWGFLYAGIQGFRRREWDWSKMKKLKRRKNEKSLMSHNLVQSLPLNIFIFSASATDSLICYHPLMNLG